MPPLKDLKTKKGRDQSGLFLVEGEKFIAEIPEEYRIRRFVVSQKYAGAHGLDHLEKKARCEIVRDSLFNSLADTVTPQGVIAVCEKRRWSMGDIVRPGAFIFMGEALNDPGNVGTLLRTAAAAGASGAILTGASCDIYSPKVLRAAAGAVLRLPVLADADPGEAFDAMNVAGIPIYAAHPRGDVLPYDLNLRGPFALLVGSESHGISKEAARRADALVNLPMHQGAESLNASVAGSILMYEAVRQRLR